LFFFVLAIVNEIAWRSLSDANWSLSKVVVSFPLTLVFAFLQLPLLKRHYDGKENPFA
jgi:intracellular septation protein